MRPLLLAVVAASLVACQTVAPARLAVDPTTRPNCERACGQVGMRLAGIVFVSEYGGCVCEVIPPAAERSGAASSSVPGQGAALGGGLAVLLAAEAQQKQQHQMSTPPGPPTSPPGLRH